MHGRTFALLMSVVIAALPGLAQGETKILKDVVKVERKATSVKGSTVCKSGDALTQWFFHCKPDFQYDVVDGYDGNRLSIKVKAVNLRLGLTILQWLPEKAPSKLIAHEDGHSSICTTVYGQSERIGRDCSRLLIGKQFVGNGRTRQAAIEAACKAAALTLCDDYTGKTNGVARQVSDLYDSLTQHGARTELNSARAVKAAFKAAHQDGEFLP